MKNKIITIALLIICSSIQVFSQEKNEINQTDENGLKQGYWEKSYPNGTIQYSGTFKNNRPVGQFKRYNQEGDLVAEMNYQETSERVYTKFYYPGKILRAEGYFLNKLKDSVWVYYTEDGSKINEVPYVNDKKHGTEKKFYTSGALSEISVWNNGINDGLTKRFYESGAVMMRIFYNNGKLDGEYNVYDAEENILIQGQYKNNKREGKWLYYKENGHIENELNYVNGIADNQEELELLENEQIKQLENNKGKIQDPNESMYNAIPPQ